MSHPNIFKVFGTYMQKQGATDEAQKAFSVLWNSTDSPHPNEATPIPCPQCFLDGITGQQGIKATGVPEGYPATENGKELEYFKCAFCKTRYWKLAE
jgi:hypothetical protein